MGAAASVRAGEEIANSIARIHPTLSEKKTPRFTQFFRHYTRKGAYGSVFPNDQEAFNRFSPFERLKQPITSSSDDTSEFLSEISDDDSDDSSTSCRYQTNPDEEEILRSTITQILLESGDSCDDDESYLAMSVEEIRIP